MLETKKKGILTTYAGQKQLPPDTDCLLIILFAIDNNIFSHSKKHNSVHYLMS
jgi:hypothetical protein